MRKNAQQTKHCWCGEDDPSKFYPSRYDQCKKCCKAYQARWYQQLKRDVQAARQAWKERAS